MWPAKKEQPPPKFQEHPNSPYSPGDVVRVKGTRKVFEVAFVACMGEPGHREVRYYPKGDFSEWQGYWWYAEDLELVHPKGEGWGGQNPEPKRRKRRWRRKRENG